MNWIAEYRPSEEGVYLVTIEYTKNYAECVNTGCKEIKTREVTTRYFGRKFPDWRMIDEPIDVNEMAWTSESGSYGDEKVIAWSILPPVFYNDLINEHCLKCSIGIYDCNKTIWDCEKVGVRRE